MRGRAPVFGVLLVLGLAAVGSVPGRHPPERPHAFLNDEKRCAGCHRTEPDGEDWILDPHLFVVSVVEACRGCHPAAQMGRSHPVEVAPSRLFRRGEVPEALPLHWSDAARAEVVTCGTCHNPHLPRLSPEKLHSLQRPAPGGGGYLTYYLRIRGKTPREGFTPLCHACHPGL